ncbi:UDP-N-acetylglucosamine 4,6-dehydratase (inverting) [Chrysiogenes arsenatis]|uniref:UDP-N-acetylglucosamine 4,6-dehydratase (inverting) n=1 Tax=Chrysiogenes arsenatis TaxID=309797 RepID=UPI000423797D|nr:UDP-N-acetylglucosamine 4,6-dehydratase (inverting) [Chrysiogenes arsenatis]
MSFLDGKSILITGGTGSFGKKCIEILLRDHQPKRVVVYSRDELKQFEMQETLSNPKVRYFLGDVRDKQRLTMALKGIDYVIHAAALKQVPACEYNPFEAVKTNILGAQNIIEACLEADVKKVIALSTDKAANPVNLYGATKLCSDKLFIAGNAYSGGKSPIFSVVRYGNVIGSRGSVIPIFKAKAATGEEISITDSRMTRFWITLEQGVQFVLSSFQMMHGGEIFVPKIPSMNIMDLALAIAPNCQQVVTGIRPGEKLHEVMVPEDDARSAVELDDRYVILPQAWWWKGKTKIQGTPVPEGFVYSSDNNAEWLGVEQLRAMIGD